MFAMYTYTCQTGCTATRGMYVDNIGLVAVQSGSSEPVPDVTAPITSITAPAANATVAGTVTVSASANDNVAVTNVEFFVDGTLAATDTTAPYEFSWNTTTLADGVHTVASKAYDAAGNAGTSASVSVTVSNAVAVDTIAPATAVTAPAGATVSGTTTVTASATDNVAVTNVEFFVDGTLAATDTTAPYSFTWNTTTAVNGAHSLSTKAYDAAGNAGTSASVSVTVSNSTADITGPVISNVTSRITNSKNASFEVTGTTNEASDSAVSFDNQATWHTNATMVTSHVMSFRGSKGTRYTYYVRSTDAAGNTTISGPFTHQN